jgi:hypothetical protein
VIDPGLNEPLAPVGRPVMDKLMLWADPDVTAVEMVLVPEVFCTRLKLEGLAEIEKSLLTGAVIVSATVVECVWLPSVPVMVKV